jgi:hypothetical protein
VRRHEALTLLPSAHAVALRLVASGAPRETVAIALGVEIQAVDPLVRVAERKLQEILESEP